ncbi:MAG: hypothetical protein M8863_08140 [marine benthic group bacterium]|nr:hypothetical protein [Gemmatimonadota bacterium]
MTRYQGYLVLPLALGAFVHSVVFPAVAQESESVQSAPPVLPAPFSLGQPERPRGRWGALVGYNWERSAGTSRVFANLQTSLPLLSALDLTAEGAIGNSGRSLDGAVGAYVGIPWLRFGVDYDFLDRSLPFGIIAEFALKRGGLFRSGDMVRVDFRPSRRELLVGASLRFPFQEYRMTRPRERGVEIPPVDVHSSLNALPDSVALPAELERELRRVTDAMEWIDRLVTPRFGTGDSFEASARPLLDHLRTAGHSFADEEASYHDGLDRIFAKVLDGSLTSGRALAAEAERVLLERMLIPFNRLLGQQKSAADAGRLALAARLEFASVLEGWDGFAGLPAADSLTAKRQAGEIFRRLTSTVTNISQAATDRWRERVLVWTRFSELAWLPLNFGLRREQYDTQEEWDALLSRLSDHPFTTANTVKYLMFEQFHLELKRMIRETEYYQVTLVHDFRGVDTGGGTDIYGWDMVVDGYLEAFIRAIDRLDGGEIATLPQFFLILDEHYYRHNHSRGIITYLENLWDPDDPPVSNSDVRAQVKSAQERLREAVLASPALGGLSDESLRGALKVNVNITNPFDPTFLGDNLMRDHRKLAVRDVFEENPGSGVAIFTGQGIGAHYNGSGWEDRSILVRGEALAQLKSDLRRILLRQSVRPEEIPAYLQPRPFPPDYRERCDRLRAAGWNTPVSIPMNETGYGSKSASVLKATMYNLAPPGSRILSFDSLWLSEFWAGMFIGAALRGVNAFPVAPTPVSAPSAAGATLHFLRENIDMMFRAQLYFSREIEREGGRLRVGLYNEDVPVDDLRKRISIFIEGTRRDLFIGEMFRLDPSVTEVLRQIAEGYTDVPLVALRLRSHPRLHLKNQLFGTKEAFELVGLPEWLPVLGVHMEIRRRQLNGEETEGLTPALLGVRRDSTALTLVEAHRELLRSREPGSEDRVIWTWTIGSMNQDHRSLALDGEALVAVGAESTIISFIDFMFILAIVEWPASREDFDTLFPPDGGGIRLHYDLLKSLL